MHVAAVEYARNVLGIAAAHSSEIDPGTPNPVIHLMEEQRHVSHLGGTMRLGTYPCALAPGTLAQGAYGAEAVQERHRHRYEFNNDYRKRFSEAGFRVAGVYPEKDLVEILEMEGHPWFVGVQFHPEFLSRPVRPHPLFREFVAAATRTKQG